MLPSLPWAQIFSRASIFGHLVSIVLLARETDTTGETTAFLRRSVYAVFAPFAHKLFDRVETGVCAPNVQRVVVYLMTMTQQY